MIVLGGGNDTSEDPEDVAILADTFWSAIKAARPNTPLVVVGAQSPNLFAGLEELNDALRTAANASEDVDLFVDMWEPHQWFTGTSGTMEDHDGNGNRDMFISQEALVAIHPGHAGAKHAAGLLQRAMRGAA
jgi:hypothetical protein